MTLRARLKATIERGCVRAGVPAVARLGHRRDVLILAYHNIVPDDHPATGDRSLHLPRSTFARQLDLLCETHDVVPLSAVLNDAPASGGRARAVLTFDDGYHGAVTAGIDEIVQRGLPATIFVAPSFVGGRFFWWDLFVPHDARDDGFRRTALEQCQGKDDVVCRWAETSGREMRRLPEVSACASLDDLRAAAARPGITIASHTWSHANLARLTWRELGEELTRPLAWLGERFGSVLPVISYPYGLSSPDVERAAAAAGYCAGVLVAGGWMSTRPRNPLALPRLNVPAGISADGFRLQTAWPFRS